MKETKISTIRNSTFIGVVATHTLPKESSSNSHISKTLQCIQIKHSLTILQRIINSKFGRAIFLQLRQVAP